MVLLAVPKLQACAETMNTKHVQSQCAGLPVNSPGILIRI
jgi:hypothetical protein